MIAEDGTPLTDHLTTSFISSHEGRGCIFNSALKAGEILHDKPLYSYIHHFSRKACLICDHCFRPIGSLIENINHLLQLGHTKLSANAYNLISLRNVNLSDTNASRCKRCHRIFCSPTCMEDSGAAHKLLCEIMTTMEHKDWFAFKRYCLKTNENFYFVGWIYLNIIAEVTINNGRLDHLMDQLSEYYEAPWHTIPCKPDDTYLSENDKFESASHAFRLLSSTLMSYIHRIQEKNLDVVNRFFHMDYFLHLLGKVELVAVEIEIENPLNRHLERLMEDPSIKYVIGESLAHIKCLLYGLDYSDQDIDYQNIHLPDILGVGIYESLSRLNHSCRPNLEIDYDQDNVARVQLIRPVSKGDQATIAYIDVSLPLEERRKELWNNYQFTCHCEKCLDEDTKCKTHEPKDNV